MYSSTWSVVYNMNSLSITKLATITFPKQKMIRIRVDMHILYCLGRARNLRWKFETRFLPVPEYIVWRCDFQEDAGLLITSQGDMHIESEAISGAVIISVNLNR